MLLSIFASAVREPILIAGNKTSTGEAGTRMGALTEIVRRLPIFWLIAFVVLILAGAFVGIFLIAVPVSTVLANAVIAGRAVTISYNGITVAAKPEEENPKVTNCRLLSSSLGNIAEQSRLISAADQAQLTTLYAQLQELRNKQIALYPNDPTTSNIVVRPRVDELTVSIKEREATLSGKIKGIADTMSEVRGACGF